FICGGEGRRLGRTVAMNKMSRVPLQQHLCKGYRVRILASGEQIAQLRELSCDQPNVAVKKRRCQKQCRDSLLLQDLSKLVRLEQGRLLDHYHASSRKQRSPHLERRRIK